MTKARARLPTLPIPLVVVGGYTLYLLVAFGLLQFAAAHHHETWSAIDDLFVAASAVSTTGLVVGPLGEDYTLFGQIVILSAFQVGGLGYMTLSSFIALELGVGRMGHFRQEMSRGVFGLPEGTSIRVFIRSVVLYSVALELIGALLLTARFRADGHDDALWFGVFHSVSAFCTAGFSLFPNSFIEYADDLYVNAVVSALSIAGAIGFIVVHDLALWMTRGRQRRISLTSKVIIVATMAILVAATALSALAEGRLELATFFQVMSASTTVGFSSVDVSRSGPAQLWVLLVLMVVGAAPSGTGGGLKLTTVIALLALTVSNLRGRRIVSFLGRTMPLRRVREASAAGFIYLCSLWVGVFSIFILQPELGFVQVLFEAASALGTVGLSLGITSNLSTASEVVVIVLMFVGRVGAMTSALAFSQVLLSDELDDRSKPEEDLAL